MIQVKEFIDTDNSHATTHANEFLAGLKEEDVINVCFGSFMRRFNSGTEVQRSAILVVYRVPDSP